MADDPFVQQLMQIFGAGERTAAPGAPGMTVNPADFSGDPSLRPDALIQRWQQDYATANAHFDVMKKMTQPDRIDYMKNVMIANGVPKTEVEADPAYYAQRFMHEVHNKPGSAREYDLAASDAKLFFGIAP